MSRPPPYRLLSLLLLYPDEELLAARPALAEAIRGLPASGEKRLLQRFWAEFGDVPGIRLREAYVETFDLQKRASLYLSYFSEGDTRKRGMALLRLKRAYREAGLEPAGEELPDYLPLILELGDLAPALAARILSEHRRGIELLRLHLTEAGSPYRYLLEAISSGLPRLAAVDLEAVARLLRDGPPAEQVGLAPFAPPDVVPAGGGR